MIDFWPNPAWHFVRSKVMLFLPGLPLACSAGALPQPDDVSGLEVFTKKPVKFGDNGEYICKNRSLVIQNHEMRLSIEKVHSMYFFCFSRYIIFLSVNWIEPELSDNYISQWFFFTGNEWRHHVQASVRYDRPISASRLAGLPTTEGLLEPSSHSGLQDRTLAQRLHQRSGI